MSEKRNCDVALDLMLLAQEGLSREGSKEFLQEHLDQCEACRETYEALKLQPASLQEAGAPFQEDQALIKGMKRAGKTMRLWRRIVAACVAVVLVILAISGIQAWQWNRQAAMPLELYNVHMSSFDESVHLDVECFATNYYGFRMTTVPQDGDGLTAENTPVIVTYMVDYYPARAAQQQMVSPASRREEMDYFSMCIKDGQVYMVPESKWIKEDGEDVLLMVPGSPVAEIRVSDGHNTRTIYTQGDEVPEKPQLNLDGKMNFRIAE